VAGVALRQDAAGDIRAFVRAELVEARVHLHFVADVVEDEELGFRTDVDGIADAGGGDVGFRLLGD